MITQDFRLAMTLARREMRSGFKGFGVFWGCLFLGVAAISAVGSFAASAKSGLLADAKALLGGDVEITRAHQPLHPEEERYVREHALVVSSVVEMRAMARGQVQDPTLVELKAVDQAYPLHGTVKLVPNISLQSAMAEQQGFFGTAVDPLLLSRLGLRLGDRIQIGDGTFELRATIEAEPDRSFGFFSLGPRVLVSREGLNRTGLLAPGSLISFATRIIVLPKMDTARFVSDLNNRFPDAGWRVRQFQQAAPRLQVFLDRLAVNLTLVGLTALLIGGLGVSGAVRGYLDKKVQTIAAMKCIGASTNQIFTVYVVQIMILAAFGVVAGLFAGALVPFGVAALFPRDFPLPLQLGLYPLPLAAAAIAGLLTALVFSLPVLGRAVQVSPAVLFRGYLENRAARLGPRLMGATILLALALIALAVVSSGDKRLALWFCAGAAACFLFFRFVSKGFVALASRLPKPQNPSLRLGLANIHRPGAPAVNVVFSLGLGMTALVAVALVDANLKSMVEEQVPKDSPAFFFIDVQDHQIGDFRTMATKIPGTERVESMPNLRGRITRIADVPVEQRSIKPEVSWAVRSDRSLTYAAAPPSGTKIVQGKWWGEDYQGPPLISLTKDLAEGFGVGVGDTLTVNILGREVTATISNLREVKWTTLALQFAVIFSPGVLESAPKSHIATVYVREDAEAAVFSAVTRAFPNITAIRVKEVLQNISQVFTRLGNAFRGMALLTLAVGVLVLAGSVSADQHRRIYDAVIFKVCGAGRREIVFAFAFEFFLVGLAAGLTGAICGTATAFAIMKYFMHLDFIFNPVVVLVTVVAGLMIAVVIGLLGTMAAMTRKPALYLRND